MPSSTTAKTTSARRPETAVLSRPPWWLPIPSPAMNAATIMATE